MTPEPIVIPFGYRLKPAYGNGLVGHWKMNVNGGNILPDLSGNNNHGTLTNFGWTATSGWGGQCCIFDGINDCIFQVSNDTLNLGNIFTISAWIFPKLLNSTQVIWGKINTVGDGCKFEISASNNTIEIYSTSINGVKVANSNILILNLWQHVAVSADGTYFNFYHNGKSVGSSAYSSFSFVNTQPASIGSRNDQTGQYFNGLIDDVRTYKQRALSADEIAHSCFQQEDEWDFGIDEILDNPVPIIAYQERLRK